MENLHWLGHAGFRFDGSKVIYFDPWKLQASPRKADVVFISHEHYDHFSKDDLSSICSRDTVIVTTREAARQLKGAGIICKETKALSPGEDAQISGVMVRAVASYNVDKPFHPKSSNRLGFIVTVDSVSIYHAGDTDNIPEMKEYRCDVALLPVSGTYVMTAEEAAQAACVIRPKLAVPMHYGEVAGSAKDAQTFQKLLKGKIDVKVFKREG